MCLFLTPSLSGSNYYLCTMQYMHGDFVQRDSCHCATICTAQCTSCMGHNVTKCTTGFIFLVQASSSQFICRARLPINRPVWVHPILIGTFHLWILTHHHFLFLGPYSRVQPSLYPLTLLALYPCMPCSRPQKAQNLVFLLKLKLNSPINEM